MFGLLWRRRKQGPDDARDVCALVAAGKRRPADARDAWALFWQRRKQSWLMLVMLGGF